MELKFKDLFEILDNGYVKSKHAITFTGSSFDKGATFESMKWAHFDIIIDKNNENIFEVEKNDDGSYNILDVN